MSMGEAPPPKRRFLVEVRGVFQVEATDGDEAERLVDDWIFAVGCGESVALPDGVRVGYLRVFPESEENPGWPTRKAAR